MVREIALFKQGTARIGPRPERDALLENFSARPLWKNKQNSLRLVRSPVCRASRDQLAPVGDHVDSPAAGIGAEVDEKPPVRMLAIGPLVGLWNQTGRRKIEQVARLFDFPTAAALASSPRPSLTGRAPGNGAITCSSPEECGTGLTSASPPPSFKPLLARRWRNLSGRSRHCSRAAWSHTRVGVILWSCDQRRNEVQVD
jgi:hypothetical protein